MPRPAGDSRQKILDAALTEFAAHGFRGASVDAIARRARVNKAMIYYHFDNKVALYVEILQGIFTPIADRTAAVAASGAAPEAKLAAFIDVFFALASAWPYMPRVMMLELADGAKRLTPDTLRVMSRLFQNLNAILEEGWRAGVFRRADPLMIYFNLIAPLFFFVASAPIRDAMARHKIVDTGRVDAAAFVAHMKSVALRALALEPADVAAAAAEPAAAAQPAAPPRGSGRGGRRARRTAVRTGDDQ
ncbi:MAG: TetR/AcrR family transcriptional regulator [Acidobacteria bacterium]|nr:MAG: TetR/AcrR family transcriptional regulator [Acidobacteriota bacterium]